MSNKRNPGEEGSATRPERLSAPVIDQLGDFRIIREIGRGGMGIVYEAEQVSLGRHVALKVLPREFLSNPRLRTRFEREAKAAAKLHHTNIVPVFGVGEDDGMGYYVMQYIRGLALDKVLEELKRQSSRTNDPHAATVTAALGGHSVDASAANLVHSLMAGSLQRSPETQESREEDGLDATFLASTDRRRPTKTPPRADTGQSSDSFAISNSSVVLTGRIVGQLEHSSRNQTYWQSVALIGLQVAEALDHAHSQGVLHRDIKPANLLLDMHGTVWITDFGLAKLDDELGLTQTGDVLGTLRYMAPETFKGDSDARSEVYSLGLTLYELLAFRPAFEQTNRNRLIDQVMNSSVASLGTLNSEIPPDLRTIVHKSIEREPSHRYQTARELAIDLQRFINDEPIKARRISLWERFTRWSRHNKGLAASLASVSVLVILLAVGSMIAAGYFHNLSTQLDKARNAALGKADENYRLAGEKAAALQNAVEAAEREKELTQVANDARKHVQQQRDINRRNLYDAQIQLSQQAWGLVKGVPRMSDLLEKWRPRAGEDDLRGWEWYYLKSLEHTEETLISAHQGAVHTCVFSPDGALLATGGDDAKIVISSTANGNQTRTLKGHSDRVTSLDWHPDGSRIVSGSNDHTMRLWDAASGRLLVTVPHDGPVRSVQFSRNGEWVASGTGDRITVWDASTGHEFKSLAETAESLAWTPDDSQLVFQRRHVTSVWPIESAERHAIAIGRNVWFPTLAISPDGRLIAVPQQSDIYIRTVESGEIIKILHGHKLPPVSLCFSPDGKQLASSGGENVVNVWDMESGELSNVMRGQMQDVSCVRWHPDGKRIASCSSDVRIWNTTRSNGDLEFQTANERCYAVCWSPDGDRVATAGHGGGIEIRDSRSGEVRVSIPGHNRSTQAISWNPRKPLLASTGFDGVLRIWSTDTGEMLREMPNLFDQGRSVAWNPDGSVLAAAGESPNEEIPVIDANSLQVVARFAQAGPSVQCLHWNFEGTRLASAGFDGKVRVWNAKSFEIQQVIESHDRRFWCVAWSSNGQRLAAGGDFPEVHVWDTNTWQSLNSLLGHTSIVYALSWNGDDSRLLSASHDNTSILWDTNHYAEIMHLRQGRDQLHALAWDPDSLRLASVDSRGYLHVLDARDAMQREESPLILPSLKRRLDANPDDIDALLLRWRVHVRHGSQREADDGRAQLLASLRRAVPKQTSDRLIKPLVDLLLADTSTDWTTLQPNDLKSQVGTPLIRQADGSVLVGQLPQRNDTYSIGLLGREGHGHVEVIRLEALTDPSLPASGPGWVGGNFHLTEFQGFVKRPGQDLTPITFRSAHASHVRTIPEGAGPNDGPRATIDGNSETLWDIWPQTGKSHWLLLRLNEPVELAETDELIVKLAFLDPRFPAAQLGHFRISVSDGVQSLLRAQLQQAINENELSGVNLLAAAYLVSGNVDQAIEALKSAEADTIPVNIGTRLLLNVIAQSRRGDESAERSQQLSAWLRTNQLPTVLNRLAADAIPHDGSSNSSR